MRKLTITLGALLLTTFLLGAAPRDKINDIVKNVRETYDKLESLEANFTETTYWALADQEQTRSGKLYLQRDNKYRIETVAQIIVTDGTVVWTYSKDKDQAIINRLDSSAENPLPRDLLLKYTREYDAELKGEAVYGGMPCYDVVFTPREDEAFVVETRVLIDKKRWLALKLEQTDINENQTRYEIKDFKVNSRLPQTLFSFDIPASAEVIDLR